MKTGRLFILVTLVASLLIALSAPAGASSGSISVFSLAACKDIATVTAVGSSPYSNNRISAAIFYQDDQGQDVLLQHVHSSAFGAGPFSLTVLLPYTTAMAAGTALRVDVRLQRLSGNSYMDAAWAGQYVTVADVSCLNLCSVTVNTTDKAPADGTITLRSHYGSWFRPEGWLHGAVPVNAGRQVRTTFVGLPCGWTVRAWYYPKAGDKTPKMLPSQYWPNEYQAYMLDGTNPYTTSFANALPPTHPLEEDDPFVVE
jgi:hypothetical protein